MTTVDGYAMSSWEPGYGDFVLDPDLDDPASRGTPAPRRARRRRVGRRLARRARRRARSCGRQLARLAAAGGARWSAPSSSSSCSPTRTRRHGTRIPRLDAGATSTTSTTRCSAPRGRASAAPVSATRWRARGDGRRVVQGRVQLRPARDRVPLRRGAARPRDNHAIYKTGGEGDRRAGRAWRSRSWPSSTSARATRATSTCRLRGTDGAIVLRRATAARRWPQPGLRELRRRASSPPCASSPCSTRRASTPTSATSPGRENAGDEAREDPASVLPRRRTRSRRPCPAGSCARGRSCPRARRTWP